MKNRLKFSLDGLVTLWKSEKSFRIHVVAAILVLLASYFFRLSVWEFIIVLLLIGLVMSLEIINSAIERMVDMLAPKTHGLAREIKDILSGMVLISATVAAVIGLIIFFY